MLGIWRDARLQVVSPGTVLRDMTVISGALETARREWRWLDDNPMRLIRKPRQPDHRDRIPTWQELKALLRAMAYSPCHPVRRVSQAVAVAMLFALRTGMRAGEISGLTWDRVNTDHVWLPVTKTKPRAVPLTRKAVRLLQKMQDYDPVLVFGMNAASLDANFRKYRKRAGVEGLHFHDTRHAAATMLARKVDALTLCKIFGWTHTTQALTYYNPFASEMAQLLERPAARGRSR
jgi:integrase